MSNVVYISAAGDGIGREAGGLSLRDDEEGLRRLGQAIEAGENLWKQFALSHGGQLVEAGGEEIRIKIPADRLKEVPQIRKQYETAVGATCSVGVGMKFSEADKALEAAKLLGKDQIVLYEPGVEKVLAAAQREDHLNKAQKVGVESPVGPEEPVGESGPESDPEPQKPEPVSDPEMLHDDFAQLAQRHESDAESRQAQAQQQVQADGDQEALKAQVVKVLKTFQSKTQELEQLRQQDPDLYRSMVDMVQGMTAMARQIFGGQQQVQKSEKVETLPEESPPPEGVLHKDLMPGGKGDDRPDSEFDAEQLRTGIETEMEEHGLDEARAKEVAKDHLVENKNYYNKELDKAALKPGTTGKHLVKLPVGSQIDPSSGGGKTGGRIKIQTPDGQTRWRSVRAGVVLASDGTPQSSRRGSE